MHRGFRSLIVGALLIFGGLYAWTHRSSTTSLLTERGQNPQTEPARTAPQDKPFVTIAGPLAGYVANRPQSQPSPNVLREDHVEDSPVGTSNRLLQKTFPLARVAHFPFEIPPHAAMPRFHGTFRSFVKQEGTFNNDSANVDVLLMTDAQYAEFSAGRESESLLVVEASHYQDINFDLSPTQNHSAKYHLVFRSVPGGAPKKVVQADFAVDF